MSKKIDISFKLFQIVSDPGRCCPFPSDCIDFQIDLVRRNPLGLPHNAMICLLDYGHLCMGTDVRR